LINKTIGFYTSTFETRDGISESVKKLRDQGSGIKYYRVEKQKLDKQGY